MEEWRSPAVFTKVKAASVAAPAATPPVEVQDGMVRLSEAVLAQQQRQQQYTHEQGQLVDVVDQHLTMQREALREQQSAQSQLVSAVMVVSEHVCGPVTARIDKQVTDQGQLALQLEVMQKSDIQLRAQVHSMQQQLIQHEYNQLKQKKKKKKKKKKGRQTLSKSVPAACSVVAAATVSASVTTATTSASVITSSVNPAAEVGTTATATPATCAAVLSAPSTATPACPSRFVATALLCFLLALFLASASASAVSQDSTVPLPSFQHWWEPCNRLTGMASFQTTDSWPRTLPCRTDGDGSRVFDDGG
jgi:hypothetical protein